MILTSALAIAGLILLCLGGDLLVRGASALASRFGVSPLAIGLTVVAFGTSAPELVVSLGAVLSGANDIALGNVVGSNIANLALILGLTALIRPAIAQAKILRIDAPIMIGVSFILVLMLANQSVSRLEGTLLVAALLGYLLFTFKTAATETAPVQAEFSSAAPNNAGSLPAAIALSVAGLVMLAGGGHLLVTAAVTLASAFGVSQAVIGLTIVAVGTSLPELATSVIAALRGQGDIAIGNVIGSNIFNILGILGITAVVHPLAMGGLTWIDLGVMLGIALLGTLFIATRLQVGRGEGMLLLTCYVAYTVWLVGA